MNKYRVALNSIFIFMLLTTSEVNHLDKPPGVNTIKTIYYETEKYELDAVSSLNKVIDNFSYNEHLINPLDDMTKAYEKFGWYTNTGDLIGQQHLGVDYAGNTGDNIYAPLNGLIIKVDDSNEDVGGINNRSGKYLAGGGNQLYMIAEYEGKVYGFIFMHMHDITHELGMVYQDNVIGHVGNSGTSLAPHLHLEVFYLGDGNLFDYSLKEYSEDFGVGRGSVGYNNRCTRINKAPCIINALDFF